MKKPKNSHEEVLFYVYNLFEKNSDKETFLEILKNLSKELCLGTPRGE